MFSDEAYSDDDTLDDEMCMTLQMNENKVRNEVKNKIVGTNTYMNSLNVLVGKQNTGKTYTAIREIIKVCRTHFETHLVIYVNKNGTKSDGTFESLKSLIPVPIKYVSQKDAEQYIHSFLEYKECYNTILSKHLVNELPVDMRDELFENLYIDDFSRPYLHTIVYIEDATKSVLFKSDTFLDLLTQCRHINCSFFIVVHYFKALSTTIKSNIDTLYIFGGFSKQQFSYICYQSNISAPTSELYHAYTGLSKHSKLIIDCENGLFTLCE